MRKTVGIAVLGLVVFLGPAVAEKPTVYPGAVPSQPGSTHEFLTKDSYADVRAYYVRERGEPKQERILKETGQKSAWFVYIPRLPDAAGVRVEKMHGESRWANVIFRELKSCVEKGFITEEELEKIEEKYSRLRNYYYLTTEDGRDDEIIYKKYRDIISMGLDPKALEAQLQELLMKGELDRTKIAELRQKIEQAAIRSKGLAESPEVVDEWVKALEELAAASKNAYPIRIHFSGF